MGEGLSELRTAGTGHAAVHSVSAVLVGARRGLRSFAKTHVAAALVVHDCHRQGVALLADLLLVLSMWHMRAAVSAPVGCVKRGMWGSLGVRERI